jgi:hypothetical protein
MPLFASLPNEARVIDIALTCKPEGFSLKVDGY